MKYRLPYHLITEKDTFDDLDIISNYTNSKLKTPFLMNRCIKFTRYVVQHGEFDNAFKQSLNEMLDTDNYKKFFFKGGL